MQMESCTDRVNLMAISLVPAALPREGGGLGPSALVDGAIQKRVLFRGEQMANLWNLAYWEAGGSMSPSCGCNQLRKSAAVLS